MKSHNLLTIMSFQTFTTFFCGTQIKIFWRMLVTVGKQFRFPVTSTVWRKNTYAHQWGLKLFGYQHYQTYYAPFYNMQYKSLVSPECVCEVSAQNTPQIIYYMILKMPIFWGSRNTLIFVPVSLNPNELR